MKSNFELVQESDQLESRVQPDFRALSELELAVVGGGQGDICLG